VRTRRVGDHALLVLVDDSRSAAAVRTLVIELATRERLPMPRDVVPAAETVLVDGLPGPQAVAGWRSRLEAESPPVPAVPRGSPLAEVVLDTTYDGADLDVVAEAWGCSPEAFVSRHQEAVFVVAFCGFAPGFAYCVPAEPLPEVRRRDDPRQRVPSGSVALAGKYCGVYPAQLPGGWQLVGRTEAVLFDPRRDEPALLVPGAMVRFRAVP
jgi:allophanate hydrolase subunit 1